MNAKSILRLASVVAVGMLLATMVHADVTWSGYTQARFNYWDTNMGKPDSEQFQLRRTRLKAVGTVNDDTTITLQADFSNLVSDEKGSSNIELKDALISRKINPEWKATLGYTQMPFGYEVPSSDAANWCFEKSMAMNSIFPGERDTGLYFHYTPARPNTPMVDFGYSNGFQKWYNADAAGNRDTDSKAYVARVQLPLARGGSVGLSGLLAQRSGKIGISSTSTPPNPGTTFDFSNADIWGAHVNYVFPKNWTARAEYYDAKLPMASGNPAVARAQKVTGWYGYADYKLDAKPITIFARYDTYDTDTADNYNRVTGGIGLDRTKNDRYTLQVERITDDGKGNNDTNVSVQWQVKY